MAQANQNGAHILSGNNISSGGPPPAADGLVAQASRGGPALPPSGAPLAGAAPPAGAPLAQSISDVAVRTPLPTVDEDDHAMDCDTFHPVGGDPNREEAATGSGSGTADRGGAETHSAVTADRQSNQGAQRPPADEHIQSNADVVMEDAGEADAPSTQAIPPLPVPGLVRRGELLH